MGFCHNRHNIETRLTKEEYLMKKRVLCLVLALLMLCAVSGCASSDNGTADTSSSRLQTVLDRGHLIVGTGSSNIPWHFVDENGNYAGFDIEMAKILANALFDDPEAVEFVEQSSDSRIANVLTGKVDICIDFLTITSSRAQQIAFSVPYYTEAMGLLLPTAGEYGSYEELMAAVESGKEVTIAVMQNADAEAYVQTAVPGAKVDTYEEQALVYQAVASGQADGGVCDKSNVSYLVGENPDLYFDAEIYFNQNNFAAGMDPNDQVWVNYVNTVFMDCMTGMTYAQYNAAYEKWFGVQLPEPSVGKPSIFS